ncbi:MAG: aminopeptidase [Xanthomonadales bacterium]|jgi:predicted aminopeptidase|nr:aminopeptidase [Xanthomonadales bacterium]
MTEHRLTSTITPKLVFLLPVVLLLGACASPSYYAQAVSGHLELMRQRQDIDDLLQDQAVDPELAQRLQLTRDIRAFAFDSLGLPESESYTQYAETGRDAVSWNVVAAPEFSLEARTWCFLVAGCVPYRGYFEQESARRFAQKLERKSYDVAVSPASAYSTLGWFNDPLLDTMLGYSDARIAGLIFHELAHQTLYVKGDAAFNEAFAGLVEEAGVESWLASRGEPDQLASWKKSREVSRQFTEFLASHRERLRMLYGSGTPETDMRQRKQLAFERLRSDYQDLVARQWGGSDYFAGWFQRELNNAGLALVDTYRGGSCAFESLYRSAAGSMPVFLELAAAKARLGRNERAAWLGQECSEIASAGNL